MNEPAEIDHEAGLEYRFATWELRRWSVSIECVGRKSAGEYHDAGFPAEGTCRARPGVPVCKSGGHVESDHDRFDDPAAQGVEAIGAHPVPAGATLTLQEIEVT